MGAANSPNPNTTLIPSPILSALTRGQTILTPNQRGARSLRLAFDQTMQQESRTHWTPPAIFALDTWLPSLWHQMLLAGDETRLLLNRTQEHTLWRAIISTDREVSGLRSSDSLAEMAAQAWRLTCLYNARPRLRDFGVSTDTRAFERWAREFERRCTRNQYLAQAQLPEALAAALANATLPIPNEGFALVDFDLQPPAHTHLFDSIRQAGYSVDAIQTTLPQTTTQLCTTPDAPTELHAAALFAASQLAANPATRIAVVVPDLAAHRASIDRAFHEVLSPETQPITAPEPAPLYEFSLGRPLAETALCATALDLLRWTQTALPLDTISRLLLSPFFGAASTEALATADFDAFTLRRTQFLRPELTLTAFADLLGNLAKALPDLQHRARTLLKLAAADQTPNKTHAEWTDTFRKLLSAAGWTASSERDSESFQVRRRWESVLDEVATLDFDGTRPTAHEAFAQLTRIAGQTIFALESRSAPIQIVGPLELGGLPFDALWFLGANDLTWPPASTAHPLIPFTLQRETGMPGADSARDTLAARALTTRIAASAPNVVFSYPAHTPDGAQRPSSLLAHLPPYETPAQPTTPAALPYDQFPDTESLPPLPDTVIRGGASILQLQAACAFRAFAERRLHSTELESRDLGLDPGDQGNIVHKVMEHFWLRLHDQKTLLATPTPQQNAILNESIDEALTRTSRLARSPWDSAYLAVQRQRLHDLLRPWLDFEMDRPAFTVREQEKEARNVQIGPLHLDLRVDRVDDTEGGPLIIDYKTGLAAPSDWLSDRPDAPQLPLYAVLADESPGGLAFALLRAGDALGLKGFASNDAVLAKSSSMKLPLEAHLEDWYRVLINLAQDFAAGHAAVEPKSYPNTCKYCTQRILCRLDVSKLDDTTDDDSPANFESGQSEIQLV